jgi:hypothetical protein
VAGVVFVERRWVVSRGALRWVPYGLAVAGLVQTVWMSPAKRYGGFGPVAAEIIREPQNGDAVILISSDASGEGMFIAETAMRQKRPGHIIRRSSKLLASQTWSGADYRPKVEGQADLVALLENERIDFIVVDDSIPDDLLRPHHQLLRATVTNGSHKFALRGTYPVRRSGVALPNGLAVYEMRHAAAAGPAGSNAWRR